MEILGIYKKYTRKLLIYNQNTIQYNENPFMMTASDTQKLRPNKYKIGHCPQATKCSTHYRNIFFDFCNTRTMRQLN